MIAVALLGPEVSNHEVAIWVTNFILLVFVGVGLLSVFLMVRNQWVYRNRIRWLDLIHEAIDQEFIHGFVGYCVVNGVQYRKLDLIQGQFHSRLINAGGPYDAWMRKFWCFKVEDLMQDREAYRFVMDPDSALRRHDYKGIIIWITGHDTFHNPADEIPVQ